jgi:RNA polymerase sigma-70 factor (ECF subfamily)
MVAVGSEDSVHDEETELMLRAAAGEAAAFEALVERVLPRLLGYLRSLGAERATAEDCAQEVLLKVYRARGAYRPRARFVTYLFHVARTHWIDLWRRRRAGPRELAAETLLPDGGGADELPGAAAEPSARAERHDLTRALRRAVEGLGPEHREVFVLAQMEGLRYEEIASLVGIPVGTVKSRMHTAVRQLRARLRAEGFEP